MKSKWIRRLRDIAILLAVVAGVRAYQQRDLPSGAAPPIEGVALDAGGEIRFREVGYTTELGLRARMWWAGL